MCRVAFFKDAWRIFDFAVVAIALVPAGGPPAIAVIVNAIQQENRVARSPLSRPR